MTAADYLWLTASRHECATCSKARTSHPCCVVASVLHNVSVLLICCGVLCCAVLCVLWLCLRSILSLVPPWVRVYRIQRDIPMPLVTSGVEKGNLRQLALARMAALGLRCRCEGWCQWRGACMWVRPGMRSRSSEQTRSCVRPCLSSGPSCWLHCTGGFVVKSHHLHESAWQRFGSFAGEGPWLTLSICAAVACCVHAGTCARVRQASRTSTTRCAPKWMLVGSWGVGWAVVAAVLCRCLLSLRACRLFAALLLSTYQGV